MNQGNAFTPEMLEVMITQIKKYHEDPSVRVLVLTGAGSIFCSGMDLSAANQSKMGTNSSSKTNAFIDFCELLRQSPLPIIARVNGPVLGGGCVLLFLADVRIMVAKSYIQFSEVKRGLLPAMISVYIVPSLGPFISKELFLTGRKLEAQRCYSWGFITALANDASHLDTLVKEFSDELISSGTYALSSISSSAQHLTSYHGGEK